MADAQNAKSLGMTRVFWQATIFEKYKKHMDWKTKISISRHELK
jgi:hypothetical protein